jgi:hypothetical protein
MILAVNKRDSLLIRPGDLGVKPKQGPSFCCPSEIRLEIERVRRDSPHDLLLGMSLDPFALLLSQLLDLAAHDTECSAQDHRQSLVKVAFAGVPDHDQFVLWRNRNVNTQALVLSWNQKYLVVIFLSRLPPGRGACDDATGKAC